MGAITPVGNDVQSTWDVLRAGGSGIGRITHFDASKFPTKIAAEVKNFDLKRYVDEPARYVHCGRNVSFAIAAANEAVRHSGLLSSSIDPTRFGVYLGAGEGQQDFPVFMKLISEARKDDAVDLEHFTRHGLRELNPLFELEQEPNRPAGHLAALFNAQGPNLNCLTACAASSQAIGEATEIIRRGDADVMLSGGTHSMIHPFGVTGFNLLTALSTRNDQPTKASRPFDKDRDGFVLGEGAAKTPIQRSAH
jgi:3-oxoacyl-[acyl-carrier-protein] synthase II